MRNLKYVVHGCSSPNVVHVKHLEAPIKIFTKRLPTRSPLWQKHRNSPVDICSQLCCTIWKTPFPEALPLIAKGRPDYFPIVPLFIVPGSHFSVRICLCLARQGIRTPLFYIVSAEVLILPSYLTNRWAVRNDNPDIVVAAVEATTQLLAKGSSIERKKLLDADVFSVALKLRDRRSQLLDAIDRHLSYEMLNDDRLAIEMLSLFEWVNYFFPPILTEPLFQ